MITTVFLGGGCWFSSWNITTIHDYWYPAESRSEPKTTCWGAVCVGADWFLSSLPPTPTATSKKKKDKTNWEQRSNAFHRGQEQYLVSRMASPKLLSYSWVLLILYPSPPAPKIIMYVRTIRFCLPGIIYQYIRQYWFFYYTYQVYDKGGAAHF